MRRSKYILLNKASRYAYYLKSGITGLIVTVSVILNLSIFLQYPHQVSTIAQSPTSRIMAFIVVVSSVLIVAVGTRAKRRLESDALHAEKLWRSTVQKQLLKSSHHWRIFWDD